ncbi:uncharacterized protein LOC127529865 [Erpetoichthys calabaricus]|uniref:uncharacterized protein LOC127529865 n=1 Tax=Erpetoichthys calabaricus TaxID=27687 RepID=UPI002234CC69|nr:uncharacterized protein LOC127529865 [Erpetoichthys calabaricus]
MSGMKKQLPSPTISTRKPFYPTDSSLQMTKESHLSPGPHIRSPFAPRTNPTATSNSIPLSPVVKKKMGVSSFSRSGKFLNSTEQLPSFPEAEDVGCRPRSSGSKAVSSRVPVKSLTGHFEILDAGQEKKSSETNSASYILSSSKSESKNMNTSGSHRSQDFQKVYSQVVTGVDNNSQADKLSLKVANKDWKVNSPEVILSKSSCPLFQPLCTDPTVSSCLPRPRSRSMQRSSDHHMKDIPPSEINPTFKFNPTISYSKRSSSLPRSSFSRFLPKQDGADCELQVSIPIIDDSSARRPLSLIKKTNLMNSPLPTASDGTSQQCPRSQDCVESYTQNFSFKHRPSSIAQPGISQALSKETNVSKLYSHKTDCFTGIQNTSSGLPGFLRSEAVKEQYQSLAPQMSEPENEQSSMFQMGSLSTEFEDLQTRWSSRPLLVTNKGEGHSASQSLTISDTEIGFQAKTENIWQSNKISELTTEPWPDNLVEGYWEQHLEESTSSPVPDSNQTETYDSQWIQGPEWENTKGDIPLHRVLQNEEMLLELDMVSILPRKDYCEAAGAAPQICEVRIRRTSQTRKGGASELPEARASEPWTERTDFSRGLSLDAPSL